MPDMFPPVLSARRPGTRHLPAGAAYWIQSARDGEDKLIRRSYWLDMDDRTLVMVMVNGIGANLTNEEKRAHLIDLRREHLIARSVFRKSFRRRDKHPYGNRFQQG